MSEPIQERELLSPAEGDRARLFGISGDPAGLPGISCSVGRLSEPRALLLLMKPADPDMNTWPELITGALCVCVCV